MKRTRPLVIDAFVKTLISAALQRARNNVISREFLEQHKMPEAQARVKFEDRPPGFERPPSQFVQIPYGYLAAISFEEQPAGLCKHLSVSVDGELGALPNPYAIALIAEEFGMLFNPNEPREDTMVWLEEFEPGHEAVNLVQPVGVVK